MTARIFLKLLAAVIGMLAVALVAVDVLASRQAEDSYIEARRSELIERARLLVQLPHDAALASKGGARLTWIKPDGWVRLDSEADARNMENHSHRVEVETALAGRIGSSVRESPTLGVKFLYVAIPVPDGAFRVAIPLSELHAQVGQIRRRLLASTALAFLPSVLIAAWFARRISRRMASIISYAGQLAHGNFRARLGGSRRGELGVLAAQLDETGRELERVFEELQRNERIRKDFVINVSHELRTPLASIQGYTETLLAGALHDPANNEKFLEIIRRNAERLARITEDLLTLSRLDHKTQQFQPTVCDVNRLLREGVDVVQPMAERKGINVTMEAAPSGTECFCDAEAVHQVLNNLLDNALKYTPEGGRISVGARSLRNQEVEIFVRDTGAGIPPEDLPRLFERFYRVDKARSRDLGGTGLGLAIVKHLVRLQGGDVRVESQPNKGSTFLFTLPAQEVHATVTIASLR